MTGKGRRGGWLCGCVCVWQQWVTELWLWGEEKGKPKAGGRRLLPSSLSVSFFAAASLCICLLSSLNKLLLYKYGISLYAQEGKQQRRQAGSEYVRVWWWWWLAGNFIWNSLFICDMCQMVCVWQQQQPFSGQTCVTYVYTRVVAWRVYMSSFLLAWHEKAMALYI